MNKISKSVKILMTSVLAMSTLIGCGSASSKQQAEPSKQESSAQTNQTTENKVWHIGVVQLVEHAALDAAYQGFVDGLKEAGYEEGKNIVFDYQNAQGEQANCQTIATKLVNDKSDLILAIATPAAQAVANMTKDIPILITAVTDPQDAKLVAANDMPGGNVTGTSDLTPVKEQMGLLKEIAPQAQTVGMIYCSSEANSKFQVDMAKAEAEILGMKTIDATVSNSNEIQQVVQSLVGKVDAIYAPTDNMIAAGMATVSQVAETAKIPLIVGEEGMVGNGGLATYGISYYNLGKLTAKQAVSIFEEGKTPKDMPIEYLQDCDLFINTELAERMGLEIPQVLLDKLK